MKNDLSQSSVAVYTERRKNKSIWMRSCVIIALVVVMLTSYALIFPARTVEKELVCRLPEHVHDESCWLSVPVCGLEEDESHRHTADCYSPSWYAAWRSIAMETAAMPIRSPSSPPLPPRKTSP